MDTAEKPAGLDPRKKRLFIIGGSVLGLLFVLVMVKALTSSPPPPDVELPKKGGGTGRAPPVVEEDPAAKIEELLATCRSYSSPEYGEPNWDRAKAACEGVLEIEPIHEEANRLLKKIDVERACQAAMRKGEELVQVGRIDEGLESYGKVRPDCPSYFMKALTAVKEPLEQVKKRVGTECKQYSSNAKWENALEKCELYSRFACQTMKNEELYAPPGMTVKLDGPMRKNEWRPKDPLYVNFLKAREKLRPGQGVWQCPEIPVFRPLPEGPNPAKLAKDEFARRYPDPAMGLALQLYFDGKLNESSVPLQKIQESMGKASLHSAAGALQRDIENVINYYKTGLTELANDKPERAEEPFRKALSFDERLVLGDKASLPEAEKRRELERRTSFVRRGIVDQMANTCYTKGKALADRKDFRQACKVWKLGFGFSKGHNDLLKALTNVCTKRAKDVFDGADSCELLKSALDFAVDGDGYKERVEASLAEQGCQ